MIQSSGRTIARFGVLAAFLVVVLGGCYMPARFDAEIEITRRGYYSIIFDGYMVSLPLYTDLREKKLSKDEEKKRVAIIETDLTRDSSVKEFQYFKKGYFKVHWEKAGDLLGTGMVAFLRRNNNFLSVKFVKKTQLITVQGASVMKVNAKRLTDIGLAMQGQLRVRTDAKVVQHNASRVVEKEMKIYVWDIKSLYDSSPNLLIQIR
jgi:hypothetical protein